MDTPPPPFTFHAWGAGLETNLGPSATALLESLTVRSARRRNGGQQPGDRLLGIVRRSMRARVGRAIMAQLAWQVSTAFVASPCAALAPAKRFVHTSLRATARGEAHAVACTCGAADVRGAPRACCCNAAPLQQRA